jgi:hypothetical protein
MSEIAPKNRNNIKSILQQSKIYVKRILIGCLMICVITPFANTPSHAESKPKTSDKQAKKGGDQVNQLEDAPAKKRE